MTFTSVQEFRKSLKFIALYTWVQNEATKFRALFILDGINHTPSSALEYGYVVNVLKAIGTCRPELFHIMCTHYETGREDPHTLVAVAYAYLRRHRRTYSIRCSDNIHFLRLRIKCGVAKSCLGTHTALQAPMLKALPSPVLAPRLPSS